MLSDRLLDVIVIERDGGETSLEIRDGAPTVEDYRRVRTGAGLSAKTVEAAAIGLPNTWYGVTIVHDGHAVGMGRVIASFRNLSGSSIGGRRNRHMFRLLRMGRHTNCTESSGLLTLRRILGECFGECWDRR